MKSGDSFGELALLSDNPRAASIKCLTDCHFAVLDRLSYKRSLGKIETRKRLAMLEFI